MFSSGLMANVGGLRWWTSPGGGVYLYKLFAWSGFGFYLHKVSGVGVGGRGMIWSKLAIFKQAQTLVYQIVADTADNERHFAANFADVAAHSPPLEDSLRSRSVRLASGRPPDGGSCLARPREALRCAWIPR